MLLCINSGVGFYQAIETETSSPFTDGERASKGNENQGCPNSVGHDLGPLTQNICRYRVESVTHIP